MEIRNNYAHSVTFGTKIPTSVKNKLFELVENPSAKMRARNDKKKAIIKEITDKINELENSNSDFFELTIMKNPKGADSFGLEEASELGKDKIEIETPNKRNLLAKFLSIKPRDIRKTEQKY